MASPFTMANGISTCSGGGALPSATGSSALLTTMRRSGFAAFLLMRPPSIHAQVHRATNIVERGACGIPRLFAALGDDVSDQFGVLLELLGTLANATDLLDHF